MAISARLAEKRRNLSASTTTTKSPTGVDEPKVISHHHVTRRSTPPPPPMHVFKHANQASNKAASEKKPANLNQFQSRIIRFSSPRALPSSSSKSSTAPATRSRTAKKTTMSLPLPPSSLPLPLLPSQCFPTGFGSSSPQSLPAPVQSSGVPTSETCFNLNTLEHSFSVLKATTCMMLFGQLNEISKTVNIDIIKLMSSIDVPYAFIETMDANFITWKTILRMVDYISKFNDKITDHVNHLRMFCTEGSYLGSDLIARQVEIENELFQARCREFVQEQEQKTHQQMYYDALRCGSVLPLLPSLLSTPPVTQAGTKGNPMIISYNVKTKPQASRGEDDDVANLLISLAK